MLKLSYICLDDWHNPVYKDQNGKLWKDTNLGNGEPDLHSSSNNELDGEPCYPIKGEYEFITKYEENPYAFDYMMLSRMKSDCDYYLGYGRRSINALHGNTIDEHIAAMKRRWNSFPVNKKPEWLTWDQILEYELKMKEE